MTPHDPDMPPDDRHSGSTAAAFVLAACESTEYRDAFLASLLAGLKAGKRHWAIIYARILKLIDTSAEKSLAIFIVERIGAPDERALKSAWNSVAEVRAWSDETKVTEMSKELRNLAAKSPELRALAQRELRPLLSGAEEAV